MRTKLILLNMHPRILILNPYLFFKKRMAHVVYLYTLLVMGLSTFNGPFIIWNYVLKFKSNKFNSPYIMLHVIFKMH